MTADRDGGWEGEEPFQLSADAVLLLLIDVRVRGASLGRMLGPGICELASSDGRVPELRDKDALRSAGVAGSSCGLRPGAGSGSRAWKRSVSASALPDEARLTASLLRRSRSVEVLLPAAPSDSAFVGAGRAYAHDALVCTTGGGRVTCVITLTIRQQAAALTIQ